MDSKYIALIFFFITLSSCEGGKNTPTNTPISPIDPVCNTFDTNVYPFSSSTAYICGDIGPATVSIISDLNNFWGGSVQACSCQIDAPPICTGGAFVSGLDVGYIYYDRNFLNQLDANIGGAAADTVMAHEYGHNLQLGLQLPFVSGKFKELQADCFAGYYYGYKNCQGSVSSDDIMGSLRVSCESGDPLAAPWWDPNAHGTCSERMNSFQSGMLSYAFGTRPELACP